MKFQAAILEEQNAPLVVDEIEFADQGGTGGLQVGQVLVRVKASGICGAQLGEIAGIKGEDRWLPHLLGHEGAGIVERVGPGVSFVHKGDHVVMHWRKGRGIEARPPRYRWRNHEIGGGWVTTFNQFAVCAENRLTKIANDVPFDIAALMGCAVTTALGLINNDAKLKIGQSIAVLGCGGVGLNLVQGAALVGANPIIGIDLIGDKILKAKAMGATHGAPRPEFVREVCGDHGVDVFVETTGRSDMIEQAYELTAPGGKTILVGQMRFDHKASIQTLAMHSGKTLFASEGGQTDPAVDIPRYLRLWKAGKLKLESMISHRCSLEGINEALDKIRAGGVSRCVIEMED